MGQLYWSRVTDGEKSASKGKWENAISGKQLDSGQDEALVVSATEVIVYKKHNSSEKIYSTERKKSGIKSHRQILKWHMAPPQNSGKKGSIARNFAKVRTSRTQFVCAKNLRKEHFRKACNKDDAPSERSMGLAEKCLQAQKRK